VATAVQTAERCRQAFLSVTCVGGQPLIAEQEPTGSWPSGQGVKEESASHTELAAGKFAKVISPHRHKYSVAQTQQSLPRCIEHHYNFWANNG
jgi:hypothetical protein